MNEIEVTWHRVLQIWWAWLWRNLLYVMLPAGLLGAVVGIVFAVNKIPLEPNAWKIQIASAAIGIPVSIWLLQEILKKNYSGFRIALIEIPESQPAVQQSAKAEPPEKAERSA